MRSRMKFTVVALTGLLSLSPAMAAIAPESEDRRVPSNPEITYECVIAQPAAPERAETPPKELPVIYA